MELSLWASITSKIGKMAKRLCFDGFQHLHVNYLRSELLNEVLFSLSLLSPYFKIIKIVKPCRNYFWEFQKNFPKLVFWPPFWKKLLLSLWYLVTIFTMVQHTCMLDCMTIPFFSVELWIFIVKTHPDR